MCQGNKTIGDHAVSRLGLVIIEKTIEVDVELSGIRYTTTVGCVSLSLHYNYMAGTATVDALNEYSMKGIPWQNTVRVAEHRR